MRSRRASHDAAAAAVLLTASAVLHHSGSLCLTPVPMSALPVWHFKRGFRGMMVVARDSKTRRSGLRGGETSLAPQQRATASRHSPSGSLPVTQPAQFLPDWDNIVAKTSCPVSQDILAFGKGSTPSHCQSATGHPQGTRRAHSCCGKASHRPGDRP